VTTGNFVEWNHLVMGIDRLIRQGKSDDIIPTIDSVRFSFLTTLLMNNKNSILITGSSGIGKTVTMESMLRRLGQGGFQIRSNTVLGEVFNFADRDKNSMANNMGGGMMAEDSDMGNRRSRADDLQGVMSNKIQFSAQTSSNKFIASFVTRLFKKGPNTMGAPKNKTILTFIDDLNIPIADRFGDQACLEMLRFLNENGLFNFISKSSLKK
jgi:dynein heavy chain